MAYLSYNLALDDNEDEDHFLQMISFVYLPALSCVSVSTELYKYEEKRRPALLFNVRKRN